MGIFVIMYPDSENDRKWFVSSFVNNNPEI